MQQQKTALILGVWLLICAAFVYLMIVVGGVTRLTQSGLSMVEWAPIMGVFPPISESAWMAVFQKYQAFPEYQKVNYGMSLDDFKSIFWWEYGHRVLGRFIGLIYLLPYIFFLVKGLIPNGWKLKLFGLFLLGAMQGLMGWYMVKSGLVDNPYVSQYRLTAHLGLAILIFMAMLWFAMDFLRGEKRHIFAKENFQLMTLVTVVVVFIMMLSGGFVAGTKAGFIINTFPTMNGQWVPDQWLAMSPLWKNFFENPVAIQFLHRCFAVLVLISVLVTFVQAKQQGFATKAHYLLIAVTAQIALGIAALLWVVPVSLGAAHQAGAVALLSASLYVAHRARKGVV